VWIETPASGHQVLEVRDLAGRTVRRIAEGWHAAGTRQLHWDGRDLHGAPSPPGIYVLQLRAGDDVVNARFALLR